MAGTVSASPRLPITWRGTPLSMAMPRAAAWPARAAAAVGASRTSASMNSRCVPRAASASRAQAWTLPVQPGGSGGACSRRSRGSPAASAATISAVPSRLPSSMTRTSTATPRLASAARRQASILPASSRAGTRTETRRPGTAAAATRSRGSSRRFTMPNSAGSVANPSATQAQSILQPPARGSCRGSNFSPRSSAPPRRQPW